MSGQISNSTCFSSQQSTLKYMYMMGMTAMVSAMLFDISENALVQLL